MNNFVKGVLVGVGIGLLTAPMRGEEMRNLLAQRFEDLRSQIPENTQIGGYVQQVSGRVSQTANNLKGYAQEAASRVKNTASDLTDISQRAASDVKQTGQDVADTTKQTARSVKQTGVRSSTGTSTTPGSSEYVSPRQD